MLNDVILTKYDKHAAYDISKNRLKKDSIISAAALIALGGLCTVLYFTVIKSLYVFLPAAVLVITCILVLFEDYNYRKINALCGECSCGKLLIINAKSKSNECVCPNCGKKYIKNADVLSVKEEIEQFMSDVEKVESTLTQDNDGNDDEII